MTRIGKIARLPATLREELNGRPLDGEQSKQLVEWPKRNYGRLWISPGRKERNRTATGRDSTG